MCYTVKLFGSPAVIAREAVDPQSVSDFRYRVEAFVE